MNSIEQLRLRERQLTAVVDCIPGFIWLLGPDNELRYLNSKVSEYTGKTLDELRDPHWREVVHPDDIEQFVAAWTTAVQHGTPIVVEFRLRRFDRVFRWFRTTGTPIRDESGVVSGWCGVDIDVDDQKRVDEAYRGLQEQLTKVAQLAIAGELAASMANAINQPLSAVVANAHACERWLAQSPPNVARAVSTVATIVETGTRAGELVQRILSLVTKGRPVNTPLNINLAIVEALRVQLADLQTHGIVVSTVLDPHLPPIQANLALIEQVLLNLIRNAVDAMTTHSSGPRALTIQSRHEAESVIIEITDSGIGFAPDARLFEAFYTTKADGLGLGLAIAKSIIESYSGTLWASPHAPAGSTIGFRLPVPDADP